QQETSAQHGCCIMTRVVCAVEESHGAALACFDDRLPGTRVGSQLALVAPAKALPSLYPMREPHPQRGAGRDVLHPRVCRERFLLHAPRPEAFHQDALPIAAVRRLVNALDPNHDILRWERG